MDKLKILDGLYTIRWCLNQEPAKIDGAKVEVTHLINQITLNEPPYETEEPKDPKDKGTPGHDDKLTATLVVIVGHEKKAPGADFILGGSEYQYNSDIALKIKQFGAEKYPNLKIEIIYRDGIGIGGAYRKAAALKPDACIELHFNAFNGRAHGTETLCSVSSEDKKYAGIIHAKICQVFDRSGSSRGVRVLSRGARGGQSVYSLPGSANCLVEPFFGDNAEEAKMANERRTPYAMALLEGTVDWLKSQGMA